MRTNGVLRILSIGLFFAPAWGVSELDSGLVDLANGEIEKARTHLEAAYMADPVNSRIKFAYARSLTNGDAAKKLYEEIVVDSLASDSLRGEAALRIFGAYLVMGDSARAAEYEQLAERFSGKSLPVTTRQEPTPAAPVSKPSSAVTAIKTPAPTSGDSTFSLQIGSFTSYENAQKRMSSVKKLFSEAKIIEGTINGQTLYRVRLGSFPTKDEAQAFGRRKLQPPGIPFSVVRE
jgi:septal ring-binding cell division protein DamX